MTISIVFISVSFGCITLILMTLIICATIRKVQHKLLDQSFKLKLLERGLSVAEIEKLMGRQIDRAKINLHEADHTIDPRPPVKSVATLYR